MYTLIQLYIIFINDSYIFVFSDSCLFWSSNNNILFIRYLCNYILRRHQAYLGLGHSVTRLYS